MSGQLESRHFFRPRDRVQRRDGTQGGVVDGSALFAVIEWDDGNQAEVEQFDPAIEVIERAAST